MNEVLERLLVTIEGSSELLRQELRKSGVDVDKWGRDTEQRVGKVDNSFKKVATTLRSALASFGIGLSVGAIAAFTRNAINAADAVGETARAAGFSAERFQRLQFVFRQNGLSAQEFDSAMRSANTRLGQFITTGGGPAAKAIETLGLKQRILNGEIQTGQQFFDAVVEALGKVDNAAQRGALSAAIFTREVGAKMQSTLGQGTDAINAAAAAATGIFTDQTVRQADELGDAWERIASAAGNWAKAVAVGAAHQAGRAAGVEGLQGETPLERAKRLREVLRSDEEAFPNTRNQSRLDRREAIREEIRLIEEYERLLNTPFITSRAAPPAPNDGLSEIAVTTGRITSAADVRARRRRLGLEELNLGDVGLNEVTVGAQRAGSAADIIAARRGQRQARGLLELPLNEAAIERMKEYGEELEKARDRQQRFADAVAASFESRGFAALFSGKPRDAIRGLAQDLAELVIKMTILQPLAEALAASLSGIGGGPIGGVFGRIFGFAGGGRPPVGRASWVGERGPELWVPDVPGRIYSHAQSVRMAAASGGKAGPTFNFNAPIYADDAIGVRRAMVEAYAQAVATSDARTNAKLGAYNRPSMA